MKDESILFHYKLEGIFFTVIPEVNRKQEDATAIQNNCLGVVILCSIINAADIK